MPETMDQYKSRILSLAGDRDPLLCLAAAPDKLVQLTKGLTDDALSHKPAPGKWSIREIVAHLADDELVGAYRIRLILSSSGTAIQAFDQARWAETGRYNSIDLAVSLNLFRTLREANLSLFKLLSAEEWSRFGLHAERGKETLRDIARYYAGHDLNHFSQIESILTQLSA